MDFLKVLTNEYFLFANCVIIILIAIVHFVFFFFIKETDLDNIFDAFESSPLFDFSIKETCDSNFPLVFHTWAGIRVSSGGKYSSSKIVGVTDITKINGYSFCYKYISYKDLLYNGQIIKREKRVLKNTKKIAE